MKLLLAAFVVVATACGIEPERRCSLVPCAAECLAAVCATPGQTCTDQRALCADDAGVDAGR